VNISEVQELSGHNHDLYARDAQNEKRAKKPVCYDGGVWEK